MEDERKQFTVHRVMVAINSRIKFISILQSLGILLVVFGHSFHECPDSNFGADLLVYRMMYSFRMPLFVFVSSYLMVFTCFLRRGDNPPSIKDFTINKIKRLLIPFFTLTMITFIPRCLLSGIADDCMTISFDSFWRAFVFTDHLVIPFFWFLQVSFMLLVFNFIILRLSYTTPSRHVLVHVSLILFFVLIYLLPGEYSDTFSLYELVRLAPYFAVGMAYARYSSLIDRIIPWCSTAFLLFITLSWVVAFFVFESTLMIMVCSFLGIAMCVSVAKIIEANEIKIFDHLESANYMIFLFSWFFNTLSQQVLSHYVSLPWPVYTLLSLISGIYIPWLGYRYLRSHPQSLWVKTAAFLFGQKV